MIPDIQHFTKKKLSTILHNVMKEWDSKWTSITELSTLDEFYGEIIGRLWEKTLIYYKSLCHPADGCSAEEVVAAIIRKGLRKEAIKFRGSSFILTLQNHTYEVKKIEGRFNARPEDGRFSYQDYSSRWISMEKDAFAEFLFEFDAILPQVKERISQCIAAWMPHIRRQCRIADEIKALADKYLEAEEIRYEIQVFRNGNPRIRFSNGATLPMTKEVKLEELVDFFREVPELMKKRPVCRNHYSLGRDSGNVTAFVDWNSLPKDDRMAMILHSIDMNELVIPAEMAELTEEIRQQMYDDFHIRKIVVDEGNPCFSSRGGVLYNKDMTELLCYPRGKQSKNYHMPRTVSKIAPMALSNGSFGAIKLEEVFLSPSLKEIPDNCFRNMRIFGVSIPEGIESIGEYAFTSTNLVCPTLPASLRHLAATAFQGCSRMHLLNIKENNFGLEKSMLPDNGEIHVIIETFEPVNHSEYPGISVMNLTEMEKWINTIK